MGCGGKKALSLSKNWTTVVAFCLRKGVGSKVGEPVYTNEEV